LDGVEITAIRCLVVPCRRGEHRSQSFVDKECVVTQPGPEPSSENPTATTTSGTWTDAVGRLGTDWWATIVAGVITVLAVANVLPKIPW
jgi:hypothetical protein